MNRRPDPVLLLLACFWLLVLGGSWWVADYWMKSQANPNPRPTITAVGEVVLERNREGHYVVSGEINGYPVTFMIDTGATDVALSARLARKLGLDSNEKVLIKTANGTATGFVVRLATVHLGNIDMHNVDATILRIDDG
ncbi:aspartyl protease family protein [Gammaproteobacteria bacterium]